MKRITKETKSYKKVGTVLFILAVLLLIVNSFVRESMSLDNFRIYSLILVIPLLAFIALIIFILFYTFSSIIRHKSLGFMNLALLAILLVLICIISLTALRYGSGIFDTPKQLSGECKLFYSSRGLRGTSSYNLEINGIKYHISGKNTAGIIDNSCDFYSDDYFKGCECVSEVDVTILPNARHVLEIALKKQ